MVKLVLQKRDHLPLWRLQCLCAQPNDTPNAKTTAVAFITNTAHNIWATVIANKRKPYMNLSADELQNGYKTGWSTIDVFYIPIDAFRILNIQSRSDCADNLILPDLSKASDTTNRDRIRTVLDGIWGAGDLIKSNKNGPPMRAIETEK